jgi:hypothetical protein
MRVLYPGDNTYQRISVPESIPTDNGREFAEQALETWAHKAGMKLDFIRPGRIFPPAGTCYRIAIISAKIFAIGAAGGVTGSLVRSNSNAYRAASSEGLDHSVKCR